MPITVGCDPEFLVVDSTNHKRSFMGNLTDDHGNIGSDHGGRVGELRPKHGTPKEVVEHIREQMKWIKEYLGPSQKLIAGGGGEYQESIGGHIHIGGIRLQNNYASFTRWRNRGMRQLQLNAVDPEHKLIFAFDFFIGLRLQKIQGGKRAPSSSYGKASDIESKSHGFEYRTAPSWLTDPVLAESVLVIAQKIVELWQLKPTSFDVFIESKKRTARRRDYNILIPAGPECRYVQQQINNFRKVAFSKTYKMNNPETLNLWTNPVAVQEIYDVKSKSRLRSPNKINLQICQLKLVEQTDDFTTEKVVKVCKFALSEVKIHPLGDYAPWQFQLTKDLRLRPDTIYFSKDLRQYLKIKRGTNIRVRFVDLQQRTIDSEGLTQNRAIENSIFYNAGRSTTDILEQIFTIFKTGARTKIRLNSNDENDDEN